MLFARPILSVLAQGLVAGIYALQGSPVPWAAAARWFPVYATLIDVGCLILLRRLTEREGILLRDLIGVDRGRWRRDVLLGLGLIPVSLVLILGGITVRSYLVFDTTHPPALFQPLPLPASLYGAVVFPLIWGFTEQMTDNGYLAPRIEVLSGNTALAIAAVSLPWSSRPRTCACAGCCRSPSRTG